MKTCTKCNKTQPLSEFQKDAKYRGGHTTQCRTCSAAAQRAWRKREGVSSRQHRRRVARMYGLDPESFDRMLANQGGGCAICGNGPAPSRKHLDVDHDHDTGEVRALLCNPCNRAVGALKDDLCYASKVMTYIRKHIGIKQNGKVIVERDRYEAENPETQPEQYLALEAGHGPNCRQFWRDPLTGEKPRLEWDCRCPLKAALPEAIQENCEYPGCDQGRLWTSGGRGDPYLGWRYCPRCKGTGRQVRSPYSEESAIR